MTAGILLLAGAAFKVTLILAAAYAGAFLLRNASARARHGLWAAALVGALVVPFLSMALPGWSVPLLPSPRGAVQHGGQPADEPVLKLPASPGAVPHEWSTTVVDAGEESAAAIDAMEGPGSSRAWIPNAGGWLLTAWILGALFVVLRLAHGLRKLSVWTRGAAEARGPGLRGTLERLVPDLGLRRPVRVLRSEQLDAPLTWGWLRPVALLPASSDGWSSERRRIVLLHELLHVRYADWPVQVAAQLACALYWFHPLVWLAARRLQTEREQACDESVLARGTRPSEYATHLLEIARAMTAHPVVGLSMAQRHQLERRLLTMLNRRRPVHRTLLPVAGAILCMSALVVSVSAVEPWRAPAPPAPPAASTPTAAAAPSAVPAPATPPSRAFAPEGVPAVPAPSAMAGSAPAAPSVPTSLAAPAPASTPVPSALAMPAPAPVAWPVPSAPAIAAVPSPAPAPVPSAMPAPSAVAGPAPSVPTGVALPSPAPPAVPSASAIPAPDSLPAPPAPETAGSFRGTIHQADGSYLRMGHEDSDFVLERTEGDFKLRLHVEEPDTVEFSRDRSDIVRMGRRASVLIKTSTDDAWQRMEVTRDGAGDLQYHWTVNGDQRTVDREAREWLALALQVAHAEEIEERTRPLYDDLRRMSRRLD
jgi:beta-lactamase regulating signal transducer with metallopeptidase domain